MKENIFEIPLLNNISDTFSTTVGELQLYLDLFHDENMHDLYSIKQAIISLSNCMELLVKYRLLVEHWEFIFDDINKAKECNFETGDFISVNFNRGIERLKNICNIDVDKYFIYSRELHKYRNKLVHFTLNDNLNSILSNIISSIEEAHNFIFNEIIIYIENYEAVKDIKNDLNELLDIKNGLRFILSSM
ncbi:hypothetical protein [Diplocloster agilis]|uniref:hypothetical protein n=1 Tax=Diplocloster agilis TaxID=2850323 RepID=UPI000820D347|nr:hypothetical protein [Suonthocola fibrivorans]MCU6732125.1 hypothetical protein [Suonthocola fibrivorans]SCI34317.1 Uncharacterised protein [uncultured Clostridium sp.]